MKRLLTVMLCASLSLTAAVAQAKSVGAGNKSVKIGYVCSNLANQGILLFKEGARIAAEESGVDFRTATFPDGDTSAYANAVEDMADQGCDAIVVAYGGKDYDEPLIDAIKKGVKVITIDSKSEIKGITSHVGIDNASAAAMGAEWMSKALKGKGTVVMINGVLNRPTGRDRRDGFFNYMKKNSPGIKIFEVAADFNMEKALSGMEDALTALNNKVDGVYCAWDGGTISCLSVLEQAKLLSRVKLLGLDGAADALGELKAGKVSADIAQPLFGMGYYGVKQAIKAAKGEKFDADYKLETKLVTIDNVDAWIASAHLAAYMKK